MKVSVIVPIYNGKAYVEPCCAQLAKQTLSDLEFILIDDGSTDGSFEICDKMADTYDNCRVFHQKNRGVSAARNLGIAMAAGEYLGFVDVDDAFEPDMFEYLYTFAQQNALDVVSMERKGEIGDTRIFFEQSDWMKDFFLSKITMSVCNKLIKRDRIIGQLFPEGKRIHEDLAAVYNALVCAQKVGMIVNHKYHYIQREGSSSRVHTFTDKYLDAIEIADWLYCDAMEKFPELTDAIEGRKAKIYLRITKIYYLRKAPKEYQEAIRRMKTYLKGLNKANVKKYYKTNDLIRYNLYLHAFPLFLLLIKTVDKK